MKISRRGFALLTSMFFVSLIGMIAFAFMQLVPFELKNSYFDLTRAQAGYLTESCARGVASYFEGQKSLSLSCTAGLTRSDDTTAGNPWPASYTMTSANVPGLVTTFVTTGGTNDKEWSADITLYADANTANATGLSPELYRVKVTAKKSGLPVYAAEYVLKQATFAQYGRFIDKPLNGSYFAIGTGSGYSQVDGEFHINGILNLTVDPNQFKNNNYYPGQSGAAVPPLQGAVTYTNTVATLPAGAGTDGISYDTSGGVPYTSAGAKTVTLPAAGGGGTTSAYNLFTQKGIASISKVLEVHMPSTASGNTLPEALGAYFGTSSQTNTIPTTLPTGLTVNNTTSTGINGLYFNGNVTNLILGVAKTSTTIAPGGTGTNNPFNVSSTGTLGSSSGLQAINATTGLIDAGNPVTAFLEKSSAKNVAVIEMRDTTIPITIPAGAYFQDIGASSPTAALTSAKTIAAPATLNGGNTLVYRQKGAGGNSKGADLYQLYPGYPNGSVFVNGNIGTETPFDTAQSTGTDNINRSSYTQSGGYTNLATQNNSGLGGVNYAAKRTIAVNVTRNNYVRIHSELTRGDIDGTIGNNTAPSTSNRDGIGVVGYDIIYGKEMWGSSPRLYTLLMAGRTDSSNNVQPGGLVYEDFDALSPSDNLRIHGSTVTGVAYSKTTTGSPIKGWAVDFGWDPALANSPPPFYPTPNVFNIIASKESQL